MLAAVDDLLARSGKVWSKHRQEAGAGSSAAFDRVQPVPAVGLLNADCTNRTLNEVDG